jgi:hypothetical protein
MVKTKEVEKAPGKGVKALTEDEKAKKKETADLVCGPVFAAHRVITAVDGKGWLRVVDNGYLMQYLQDQSAAVQGGDLSQVEAC